MGFIRYKLFQKNYKLYANASRFILSSVFIIPMTTSFSSWNCSLNIQNGPSTLDLFAYSSLYSCFSILRPIAFCISELYSAIVLCDLYCKNCYRNRLQIKYYNNI